MKKMTMAILGLLVFSLMVVAREYSDVEGKNDRCKFKQQIGEGGAIDADYVTGYCSKCDKFVEKSWRRKGGDSPAVKGEEPPRIFKVWDPSSGQTRELFDCPDCQGMVFSIKKKNEIKFCPRCNASTIVVSQAHTFAD